MKWEDEQAIVKDIQKKIAPIDGWCHAEKVDILVRLILAYRPMRVFELGIHAGRSLCTIGLGLKAAGYGGTVLGVDSWSGDDEIQGIDPEEQPEHFANWKGRDLTPYKQLAEWAIDYLGLKSIVEMWAMNSEAAAVKLGSEMFDMIHLDASKSRTQVPRFVDLWLPRLKVGGLFILDDSDWDSGRMAQIHLRRQSGDRPYCVELIEVRPTLGSWFAVLERVR